MAAINETERCLCFSRFTVWIFFDVKLHLGGGDIYSIRLLVKNASISYRAYDNV
jgi:hypothetical protein